MPVRSVLGGCLLGLGLLAINPGAVAAADSDDEYEVKKWEEAEVQLPAPPKESDLKAFYVSAVTDNRFFVDPASISVGNDGVVRYTLLVLTSGGVRNLTFEGMRCETRERRLYAVGRSDGTWSKSRNKQWERIREAVNNRHHAALFQEYFCPGGVIVRDAEEARDALRRGGHPSVAR